MPIRYQLDPVSKCVFATGEEPVTDSDLLKYQVDLSEDPLHGAGFDQLLDMRQVSGLHATAFGIREAGRLSHHFDEHLRGTRCAVVASSGVGFGLARMFTACASDVMLLEVFQDMASARAWLGLDESPERT